VDVLIGYHRHLVEGLLLILLLNLLLPWILRSSREKRIFYTRVGYFAFWALWSMVAFSGLMVWLFAGRPLTLPVTAMLALAVLLPLLDVYRAVRLKRLWLSGSEGLGLNTSVVGLEFALTIGVTLLAVLGR